MAAERVTKEIYVPLDNGAPSYEDSIIQQALPDWNMVNEEGKLGDHAQQVTSFSRDFGETKVKLNILRDVTEGTVAVTLNVSIGGLDNSFNIYGAYSLRVNPFDGLVSINGDGGYANEEIYVYNGGLLSASLIPRRGNVSSFIHFYPPREQKVTAPLVTAGRA